MKRILLVLLLALLPLQHSWAALGSYCAHEDPATSKVHFGHHFHKHMQGAGNESSGPKIGSHADCAYCHVGCATAAAEVGSAYAAARMVIVALEPVVSLREFPSRPERPNWPAFA